MSDFVHLHVHSHYSLLDGLPKIKDLVKAAKYSGFPAIALTDHGNISGLIEFYKVCTENNIKPILGCEAYIAPISMEDRNSRNKYHHLVLLAESQEGYENLMKLVTASCLDGFYYKPRMDKELLRKYHKGLIASSACFGGEIAKVLRVENDFEKAKKIALEYQNIFGKGNFYLEMMDLPDLEGQMQLNDDLIKLSKETDIPLIVTRDVHYINKEDNEAQDIVTCIRDGANLDDPARRTQTDIDCSLSKGIDIEKRFSHIPEAIANTKKIADRCNVKFDFGINLIPAFKTPNKIDAALYLRELCFNGLVLKYKLKRSIVDLMDESKIKDFNNQEKELVERLNFELKIITDMGFVGYFLIVWDFVSWAKKNGIVVGPGRGSAAGAIVAYTLDITTIDPLKYSLLFERFLNPARISMPDIDMDFADNRRDEVIQYVSEKYGRDKVAQICTFGTLAARAAVKDVGRALGGSFSDMNAFAKLIPDKPGTLLQDAIDGSSEIRDLIKGSDLFKKITDNALKLEGMVRHMSVHACAVVIADEPLTKYTALQHPPKDSNGIITQFSAKPLEMLGLLKMDFLGLRNLTIIQTALDVIEKTAKVKIDFKEVPIDDKKTYELLSRGETNSVFQLESSGMRRYLKELKPSEFEDIIAMVALYRPGPMDWIPDYIRGKHGLKNVEYLHDCLKPILEKTYGIAIYQEQILQIAQVFSGFSLGEADLLRRAIGKKIASELEAQRAKFLNGAVNKGYDRSLAVNIFENVIEPFAGYGFNKSHAACYAMISYQTAYLKANYPIQYMTSVLIAESGDSDKVSSVIRDCEKMGVKVKPPDINESFKNFAMVGLTDEDNIHIRFGMQGIKNMGEHIADVIYKERKENGKFKNLEDLLSRVQDRDLNKKSLDALIKCGALDSFGYDRGLLLFNLENLIYFSKDLQEKAITKQDSLFSGTDIDFDKKVRLDVADDATEHEKMRWEKELLGVYVTAHPFAEFENMMQGTFIPLSEFDKQESNSWVIVGGIIESMKKKITKKGKLMLFATIQDTTDSLDLLVFPKTYEKTKDVWEQGRIVCVVGKTSEEEGDDKLFVEKVYHLTKENAANLSSQLSLNSNNTSKKFVAPKSDMENSLENINLMQINIDAEQIKIKSDDIKNILKLYSGDMPVYLSVDNKMIKTSFLVNQSESLINDLEALLGESCVEIKN